MGYQPARVRPPSFPPTARQTYANSVYKTPEFWRGYLRQWLRELSLKELLTVRDNDLIPFRSMRLSSCGLTLKEWQQEWSAEYDRRTLLRPVQAQVSQTPVEMLLRPVE